MIHLDFDPKDKEEALAKIKRSTMESIKFISASCEPPMSQINSMFLDCPEAHEDAIEGLSTEDIDAKLAELRDSLKDYDSWLNFRLSNYSWSGKNRQFPLNSDGSIILHAIKSLSLASILSRHYAILDVDSFFSSYYPSSSDVTFCLPNGVVLLIDITSSKSGEIKLENLYSDASSFSKVVSRRIAVSTFHFDQDSVINVPEFLSATKMQNPIRDEDRIIDMIYEMLKSATKDDITNVVSTLHDILDLEIMNNLPSKEQNHNSIDALRDDATDTMRRMSEKYNLSEDETREKIKSALEGRTNDLAEIYDHFMSCAVGKVAALANVGDGNIQVRRGPRSLPALPPICDPARYMIEKTNAANEMPLFKGLRTFKKLLDTWDMTKATDYILDQFGNLQPSCLFSDKTWDQPQSKGLEFPEGIIAAFRVNAHVYTMVTYKGKEYDLRSWLDTDKGKEVGIHDKSVQVNKVVRAGNLFQLLINEVYTYNDNLNTYFSRHCTSKPISDSSKMLKHPLKELTLELTSEYSSLLKSLRVKKEDVARHTLANTNIVSKLDLIVNTKCAPAVTELHNEHRSAPPSPLINLADAMSLSGRVFLEHYRVVDKANAALFIESQPYALWTLWLMPLTKGDFRTCWRKIFSIGHSDSVQYCPASFECSGEGFENEFVIKNPMRTKSYPKELFTEKNYISQLSYLGVKEENVLEYDDKDLSLVSTKYHSIDRNHLEWELELPYKLTSKFYSLLEMRYEFYRSRPNESEEVGQPQDEINHHLLHYFINRQQFSIISTSWRYLHQALGSLDFNVVNVLKKIEGTACANIIEANYTIRMCAIYKLSILLRSIYGINYLRSRNKEVFVVAPDLLYSSHDPSINISSYSINTQFNDDKIWRIDSEADCVVNAWNQREKEIQAESRSDIPLSGMTKDFINQMLFSQPKTLSEFVEILLSLRDDIRSYTAKIMLADKDLDYVSNFFFELMVHLELRLDKGIFRAMDQLEGRPITEFFTLAGSITACNLDDNDSVKAKRKITSMIILLQRLTGFAVNEIDEEFLNHSNLVDLNMDQYKLLLEIQKAGYIETITPICQYSEKDASGKSREISTLNIEFGVLCLLGEKVCQRYSASIEQDLVTHASKEIEIVKRISKFEREITKNEDTDVVYINQDKSSYGPNRKTSSMLLTAAVLSGDDITYNLYKTSLNLSRRRVISYPHEIVRVALSSISTTHVLNRYKALDPKDYDSPGEYHFVAGSKTRTVMDQIMRQYLLGTKNGPKGSTYVNLSEGMPGQGIFTTLSSISHAAFQRTLSKYAEKMLNWRWDAMVTSDDSLTMILHPKRQSILVHNGIKTFVTKMSLQMGLIENTGKMTITARRPEMNSLFMYRDQPIAPLWKFLTAFTKLETTGNMAEDLLGAVNKGGDMFRVGGSMYMSSILSCVNMCAVIDVYRVWEPIFKNEMYVEKCGFSFHSLPPEALGLPYVEPACLVYNPISARFCSLKSDVFDDVSRSNYIGYLLESYLTAAKVDQEASVHPGEEDKYSNGFLSYMIDGKEIQVKANKLPPTVNGLIGRTYRMRRNLNLAKELGQFISKLPIPTSEGKLNLFNAISWSFSGYDVPLKRGTSKRKVLDNYLDVLHGIDHKFLKVSPNSFFPKDLHGKMLSLRDLRSHMLDAEFTHSVLLNFMARLKLETKFPESFKPVYEVLKGLSVNVSDILGVLYSSRSAPLNHAYREFSSSRDGVPMLVRKIINTAADRHVSSVLNIDKTAVMSTLLSKYCKPDAIVPYEYRHLVINPMGDCEFGDALSHSLSSLERLAGLFPKSSWVFGYSQHKRRDASLDVMDWLRCNFSYGRYLNISSKSLESLGGDYLMLMAPGVAVSEKLGFIPLFSGSPYVLRAKGRLRPETSTVGQPPSHDALTREAVTRAVAQEAFLVPTSHSVMNHLLSVPKYHWFGTGEYRFQVKVHPLKLSRNRIINAFEIMTKAVDHATYFHDFILFDDGVWGRSFWNNEVIPSFETAISELSGTKMVLGDTLNTGTDMFSARLVDNVGPCNVAVCGTSALLNPRGSSFYLPLNLTLEVDERNAETFDADTSLMAVEPLEKDDKNIWVKRNVFRFTENMLTLMYLDLKRVIINAKSSDPDIELIKNVLAFVASNGANGISSILRSGSSKGHAQTIDLSPILNIGPVLDKYRTSLRHCKTSRGKGLALIFQIASDLYNIYRRFRLPTVVVSKYRAKNELTDFIKQPEPGKDPELEQETTQEEDDIMESRKIKILKLMEAALAGLNELEDAENNILENGDQEPDLVEPAKVIGIKKEIEYVPVPEEMTEDLRLFMESNGVGDWDFVPPTSPVTASILDEQEFDNNGKTEIKYVEAPDILDDDLAQFMKDAGVQDWEFVPP